MARITVYLSDDLADRLKSYRKKLNISEICSEAIHKSVTELEEMKEDLMQIQDAVLRLKASKREFEDLAYGLGYKEGYKWARDEASFRELSEVAERTRIYLHVAISPERRIDGQDTPLVASIRESQDKQFEMHCASHDLDEGRYWYGWASGADDLWNKVRAELGTGDD